MSRNELLLNKFSVPNHNLFAVSMQVYQHTEREIHVDEVINRVLKKRKQAGNLEDEVRIVKAIGLLIGVGAIDYYQGHIRRK